jgi:hypothetical protein
MQEAGIHRGHPRQPPRRQAAVFLRVWRASRRCCGDGCRAGSRAAQACSNGVFVSRRRYPPQALAAASALRPQCRHGCSSKRSATSSEPRARRAAALPSAARRAVRPQAAVALVGSAGWQERGRRPPRAPRRDRTGPCQWWGNARPAAGCVARLQRRACAVVARREVPRTKMCNKLSRVCLSAYVVSRTCHEWSSMLLHIYHDHTYASDIMRRVHL